MHKFSEKLQLMHEKDATFILSTLAQVACDRSCEKDDGYGGEGGGDSGRSEGVGGGNKGDTEVVEFLVEELFHVSVFQFLNRFLILVFTIASKL